MFLIYFSRKEQTVSQKFKFLTLEIEPIGFDVSQVEGKNEGLLTIRQTHFQL